MFRKTSFVESCLIKSYGNVLLKTFVQKNSSSENSQGKMFRESSFLVKPPATLRFSLIRFSQDIFLANQCDWIHIVLHNWSVERGWKLKIWSFLCIVSNWWKVVNSLNCRGGLQLYSCYYYLFNFRYNTFLDLSENIRKSSVNLRSLTFGFLMFSEGIKMEH